MNESEGMAGCIGCCAQVPAFLGGLIALFWWFVLIWGWLGLGWAIVGTVFLSFIPAGIMYWVLMLVFGPLVALGMTKFGRGTSGQFFVVAMAMLVSLLITAILVGSVVLVFV